MKVILSVSLIFCINFSFGQDRLAAEKLIDTLTSASFWGRGYTREGVHKTSAFLAKEFKSYGLQPLDGKSFLQQLSFPVNTFPGKMKVRINNIELVAGKDFIVSPESKGLTAVGELIRRDSIRYYNESRRLNVIIKDKLTWSVSQEAADYTSVVIKRGSVHELPRSFDIDIESKLIGDFKSSNVCGIVRGTEQPDSIVFITAHYDHLGGMGNEIYFPGANDNASGISLLLNLARYYSAHPQKYSVGFICFSGEEAGLLGSKYFTEHPLIELKNVRFLINTDLAGTGGEGITVVNATIYKSEFALLNKINDKEKYLVKIYPRGKAANSDHFWFSEKGVPSFFIYTMGGIKAYHDIYDKALTLPLTEYEDLFRLIVEFNSALMMSR